MLAPGLVKVASHPDHGQPVDYQPGQLLPVWILELLASGALLRPVSDGVFELVLPHGLAPKVPPTRKSRSEKVNA